MNYFTCTVSVLSMFDVKIRFFTVLETFIHCIVLAR